MALIRTDNTHTKGVRITKDLTDNLVINKINQNSILFHIETRKNAINSDLYGLKYDCLARIISTKDR